MNIKKLAFELANQSSDVNAAAHALLAAVDSAVDLLPRDGQGEVARRMLVKMAADLQEKLG